MRKSLLAAVVLGWTIVAMAPTGCATAPKTASEQSSLEARANATIDEMTARDPALTDVLRRSAGYAVFPDIGKGGALVGGAFGRGVLYQNGRMTGFVKVEQASIGAQLGAQTFAELLVLQDDATVNRLKSGQLTLGADVGAVALTAGAAARAQFAGGVQVFLLPRGGLMAELTISGQRIEYEPRG
jgi:lipid-binding SYLF domain-containing protein